MQMNDPLNQAFVKAILVAGAVVIGAIVLVIACTYLLSWQI